MNDFADAGKTNPIKPNFKGKKNVELRIYKLKKPCAEAQGFNIKKQLSRPFDLPFDKLRVRSGQAAKMPDFFTANIITTGCV